MKARRMQSARTGLFLFAAFWMMVVLPLSALAAPYAAYVVDARSGEVLHSRNADTRLHPASLTKMMTLYIAFEAVERGEISLDQKVTISRFAASEPPSKLGLRSGQKIAFRYLVRAAAVKSANDAATAIGEALEGSEAAFARRMNRTAKALGMTRTTFKNAHGLTENGHLSTARDMTILGRHVLYDYPQYYNLFSRRSTYAGIKEVPNTNRRLLAAYRGADGIKTGYTRAAGFNLVASAERGDERIIATVFGGTSSANRNAKVAELLDLGFRAAPSRVAVRKPAAPDYSRVSEVAGTTGMTTGAQGKTIRLAGAVTTSKRPQLRPQSAEPQVVVASAPPEPVPDAPLPGQVVQADDIATALAAAQVATVAETVGDRPAATLVSFASPRPELRPSDLSSVVATVLAEEEPEVVTRISTSGGRQWGVNVGSYPSRYAAEKALLTTALAEMATLDGSLRKVVKRSSGFDANFLGMTRETADLACRRLAARNMTCLMVGPS
ncbi:D-alanyl-D-alanine carboxypeptidase family protein [Sulfitobacter sp. D35]|uniref:D-alanyl-D-alanine carboxypeptidase family protein n=1 Tax=Sulfitobacter sp. D35 TaxID=3083252 RepID=UPI00296FE623|nr:D-alanyl-D-alanine carboxypeptidase family protein [Sulfitobacter sp. D35]MDW4497261.1 D-alanyl-D-alanine carboxypeptidase family protein [Sulfitobacter sp. D35]